MSKISRELIENYRKIVLPFVSNRLYKTNFEGQGETDKTEFEHDFNEILDLAISALNPTGDLISREALKKAIRAYAEPSSRLSDDLSRGMTECACEILDMIDNAPTVEQSEIWEGGFADGLAVGAKWVERPKGKWVDTGDMAEYWSEEYQCSICGAKDHWHNYCPGCGADMRGGAENG